MTPDPRTLLASMTVAQKIAQLNQPLPGWECWERDRAGKPVPSGRFIEYVRRGAPMGGIYGLFRTDPWSGRTMSDGLRREEGADLIRDLHRVVSDYCAVPVPIMLCEEGTHGLMALGAPVFPANSALASARDPNLWRNVGASLARIFSAWDADVALVSMLDVARDPRWSRCEESFGEDPDLVSLVVESFVFGFVGAAHPLGVTIAAKHLAAYGETLGGRNGSTASIGPRAFARIHLPPVLAALRAGCEMFMAAYNDIDGVPCHMNGELSSIVSSAGGIVIADCKGIDGLRDRQRAVAGYPEAAAAALRHGRISLSLLDDSYADLMVALEKGLVAESDIDACALPLLELKCRLGLFEKRFGSDAVGANGGSRPPSAACVVPSRADAETAIRESSVLSAHVSARSPVLLCNEGDLLPLAYGNVPRYPRGFRIALIGPHAESAQELLGDYTAPQDETTIVTLASALSSRAASCGYALRSGRAGRFTAADAEREREASSLCGWADAVIVACGTNSSRVYGMSISETGAMDAGDAPGSGGERAGANSPPDMDCGEGVDAARPRLSAGQRSLVDIAVASGKPVVLIVISGRPLELPRLRAVRAVVFSGYPGPAGADALSSIIFGETSPEGRLPFALPSNEGGLPCWPAPSGSEPSYAGGFGVSPYPFASGRGFAIPSIESWKVANDLRNGARVEGTISNTSPIRTAEIVHAFARRRGNGIASPPWRLAGFARIELAPGEMKSFTVALDPSIVSAATAGAGETSLRLGSSGSYTEPVLIAPGDLQ